MSTNNNHHKRDGAGPAAVHQPAAESLAADMLTGVLDNAAAVHGVARGDWPEYTAADRADVLTGFATVATDLVQLAADLTTGNTRRRLLDAVAVLDLVPFGAGDREPVDQDDVGGVERSAVFGAKRIR